MDTIYPVILSVPDKYRQLSGRNKVSSLSMLARNALELSAKKSGLQINRLSKDKNGAPLPCNGVHWSITHKTEYVGGVLDFTRIGVDIEKIKPCSQALFKKIASEEEWRLGDTKTFRLFFRYWTSKESVLKAAGTGLTELSKCRIVNIIDENNLVVNYGKKYWNVEHFMFDGHIASVTRNSFKINWTVITSE